MLKGSSCLCEVRASGGVRPWGGAAARRLEPRGDEGPFEGGRAPQGAGATVKVPLKAADAGNAQLDELAARAQHLARRLCLAQRRLFLCPLAVLRADGANLLGG